MELARRNGQQLREYLRWFDILFLTVLFWGEGIYTSTVSYIYLLKGETTIDENLVFTVEDNYKALIGQILIFAVGMAYLYIRKYDLSQWKIKFTAKALITGGLMYLAMVLLMDFYTLATAGSFALLPLPRQMVEGLGDFHIPGQISSFFASEQVSTVIYAIFNGIYEEVFFLCICLAVAPEHIKKALLYSIVIRFSFHTYQGLQSSLGIGIILGLFMYILYTKSEKKNLLPFFVCHALADVYGLSLVYYLS